MERHILREGTSFCAMSSSWSQGVAVVAPPCKPYPQRRPKTSDRLRIPSFEPRFSDWTDYLHLTAGFSYLVVSFRLHTYSTGLSRRTTIPLFTHQNVTACQAHRVIWNEPKMHVNYHYIYIYTYISPSPLHHGYLQMQWCLTYIYIYNPGRG